MALNEILRDGFSVSYSFGTTNPGVASGDFVTLSAAAPGTLHGVAETTATLREDGNFYATIRHIGVFSGTTTDTAAIPRGTSLFLTAANAPGATVVTAAPAAGANFFIGVAAEAKGSTTGSQPIKVRVNN